ncbi:hypothetical protein EVAR_7241_1 [Eumeta japonica]|uniref:Uncharacterized protein n=1 Tax=Eumeta variegata TaxID=151549 RepID=A0A4C1T376_EUMVA|nr:hypothetical protein EVAR_7241_1 [Eumeta japonica]
MRRVSFLEGAASADGAGLLPDERRFCAPARRRFCAADSTREFTAARTRRLLQELARSVAVALPASLVGIGCPLQEEYVDGEKVR